MRNVLLHGDDVGARHHDAFDPAFAQAEDILEHRGFGGEKPDSGCSAVSTSSRSARVAAAFQPNRMRMTRASQPSCSSPGSGKTIGETAVLGLGRVVAASGFASWSFGGSVVLMIRSARALVAQPLRLAGGRYRDRESRAGAKCRARLAPSPRRPRRARDRIPRDAGSRARQGGRHDGRKACARRGPPARSFHRPRRCRR